jgi:hypothetical protein
MLNELLAPPAELWYTAVPMVLCLLGVEVFFRNFLTLAWLGVKVAIAGLVYIHIREVVQWSFGTDPLCIESRLFGMPAGTINAIALIGLHVAKTRVIGGVRSVCPTCLTPVPLPPPPEAKGSEKWGAWMEDTLSI